MTVRRMTEEERERGIRLADAIMQAMEAEAEREPLTTGQAMTALFHLFVQSAKASPNYNPEQLMADVEGQLRAALFGREGMQ